MRHRYLFPDVSRAAPNELASVRRIGARRKTFLGHHHDGIAAYSDKLDPIRDGARLGGDLPAAKPSDDVRKCDHPVGGGVHDNIWCKGSFDGFPVGPPGRIGRSLPRIENCLNPGIGRRLVDRLRRGWLRASGFGLDGQPFERGVTQVLDDVRRTRIEIDRACLHAMFDEPTVRTDQANSSLGEGNVDGVGGMAVLCRFLTGFVTVSQNSDLCRSQSPPSRDLGRRLRGPAPVRASRTSDKPAPWRFSCEFPSKIPQSCA